ncbi:MAG: alpha-amylase family protein [Bacillota bacterium]
MDNLRFRQVHLDFHTGEDIKNIGQDFSPADFAATLKDAHVDSITCFARGHHGWLYYDSDRFPERIHPHLKNKNLLKQQIEICHENDIRVPIYITVQWDHYTAKEHPEWLVLDEEGHPGGTPLYEPGFYRTLCVNTPYRSFLQEQTREVLENFPVDGIFFDIVGTRDCSCKYCRAGMKKQGLDPSCAPDRQQFARQMMKGFKQEMTELVKNHHPQATVFYNEGHVGTDHREIKDFYTHFELESLPSGGWGYLHFPIAMRYARNLGHDCLGMTGKFHTSWGDFHSFKNQAALEYECFQMLALNAKCSIGDQLEPKGELSAPVYDLIGSVYQSVEQKEPWCVKAKAVTEIGVLTPEEFSGFGGERLTPELMGITRMLQEGGHQFDIIDSEMDFSAYRVLILPDTIPVSDQLADKLTAFFRNGGALIASYKSGLDEQGEQFNLSELGVELVGPAPYSPDFLVPRGEIGIGLPQTEHVMYKQGLEVKARPEAEILAETYIPYFNREWNHFCSHSHTPSAGKSGYPGIVQHNQAIYFAHPIFTQYRTKAPLWCKKMFLHALNLLLDEPLVQHEGPSSLMVTLNEQEEENRWFLHCLHYIPERRAEEIDIIEDVIPLSDTFVSLKVPAGKIVAELKLVPENTPIDYKVKRGRVEFEIPEIKGHQMLEISFS